MKMFPAKYTIRNRPSRPVTVNAMKWRSIHPSTRFTIALRMTRSPLDEPAVFHHQMPCGSIEIALVMSNHDDGFIPFVQGRQNFVVELLAKAGVLVGSEFIQHVDRPVFERRDHQC